MTLLIRKWQRRPPALVDVGEVQVGAYDGVAFRQMPLGEKPATATNFRNLRVTEMYMHASRKDVLVVYCEEVEG